MKALKKISSIGLSIVMSAVMIACAKQEDQQLRFIPNQSLEEIREKTTTTTTIESTDSTEEETTTSPQSETTTTTTETTKTPAGVIPIPANSKEEASTTIKEVPPTTTTKATTKATTKPTTKATVKPTTKATSKATTKPTTKATTKATVKPTTKATTKVTTKATTIAIKELIKETQHVDSSKWTQVTELVTDNRGKTYLADITDGPIKGNKKSKIYHVRGQKYYNKISVNNVEWFNTEKDAVDKGYRAAKR